MLASDAGFFVKLERAGHVLADDMDAALEIIESLPREWSSHPLILMHHTYVLMAGGRHMEALALLLCVCDQWPDDVAPFFNAVRIAITAGRRELVPKIYAHAPRAAHFYRGWTDVGVWLNSKGDVCPFGRLAIEIKPSPGLMAA